MTIAVVGLGLIGASIAKTIKARTNNKVIGFDLDKNVLVKALSDGAIDKIGNDDLLSQADIVFVALYPKATINFARENASILKKGAILCDTCGTKRKICVELTNIAKNNGFTFIGTHPMAGKETSGYDSSCTNLFDNAYMILTPTMEDIHAIDLLTDLSDKMGFKDVTIATPEEHDKIIAYTSQLPHILACAYISDPDAIKHDGFSAGSYKDVSRVATINADMWTELFMENKDYLVNHIECLIKNLENMRECVEDSNSSKLHELLANGNDIKKRFG